MVVVGEAVVSETEFNGAAGLRTHIGFARITIGFSNRWVMYHAKDSLLTVSSQ
jgi:hypothetical protein